MEIIGKVKVINANCGNEKYAKSEMVVTTDEQYPQDIMIEFGGQKSDLIDPYKVGDQVKVSINLGGRMWTNAEGIDKYFNSIKGWKIAKTGDAPVEQEADDLPY
jgi:hypothetical protein